ncbi:GAF domain-containing sensor histidine kinase [Flavobacterium psychraquaticum]|uniref:GAF domain-containing sensor histidine kinase n=1 Tax=Flavobacterium psychraquaticum TaxID=3103958 RepID=UPI002ACD9C84|nr:GAF domain-containing sensor histidine kinase [Flavobacterium sp. LB-N7T]
MKNLPQKNAVEVLEDYYLFDSDAEIEYDNITFLASKICNTPISTITLLDDKRQWFKSKIGFEHSETPLNRSFCALSISKSKNVIVVPNLMEDAEFSKIGKLNGLEKNGFYAAVTLFNDDEVALGTLCVIDYESKNLDQDQIKALQILGKQVEELFKIRLKNIQLNKNYQDLKEKYSELKQFSNTISHDIQSPINNIISLITLLNDDKGNQKATSEYLELLVTSSYQLKNYVSNLLTYYQSESLVVNKNKILLKDLVTEIEQMVTSDNQIKFVYDFDSSTLLTTDKMALSQILLNLISNGIKYNMQANPIITIRYEMFDGKSIIKIIDNGTGIEKKYFETIFENNTTLAKKDRYGNFGTGLGLSIVANLAKKINYKIAIDSIIGVGSTFTLTDIN